MRSRSDSTLHPSDAQRLTAYSPRTSGMTTRCGNEVKTGVVLSARQGTSQTFQKKVLCTPSGSRVAPPLKCSSGRHVM